MYSARCPFVKSQTAVPGNALAKDLSHWPVSETYLFEICDLLPSFAIVRVCLFATKSSTAEEISFRETAAIVVAYTLTAGTSDLPPKIVTASENSQTASSKLAPFPVSSLSRRSRCSAAIASRASSALRYASGEPLDIDLAIFSASAFAARNDANDF